MYDHVQEIKDELRSTVKKEIDMLFFRLAFAGLMFILGSIIWFSFFSLLLEA